MGGPKGSCQLNSHLEDQATSPSSHSHRHRRNQLLAVVALITFIIGAVVAAAIVNYNNNTFGHSLTYTQSLSLSPGIPQSPSLSPGYPEPDPSPSPGLGYPESDGCIKAACIKTMYPVSCFSTLSSTLNDSQKSDPDLIYRASLDIILDGLSNLSSFIQTLRGDQNPPSEVALLDCLTLLEFASHEVNNTISLMAVAPGEEIWTESKIKDMETSLSDYQWCCLDGLNMINLRLKDEVDIVMQPSRRFTSITSSILRRIHDLFQNCCVDR